MSYSGRLIVIEGGDSSGKATQTAALKNNLEQGGYRVETMSFPRYDRQIGELLGECFRGERGEANNPVLLDPRLTSVLFASDRFDAKSEIMKWLEGGKVVILDRYTSANLLHQGAKIADDQERQETIEWIYRLEHELFSLPLPDVVFYLDVPAKIRIDLQKMKNREADSAERSLEHQQQVDERADSILNAYKNTHKIDCMQGEELRAIEDISTEIYNITKQSTS